MAAAAFLGNELSHSRPMDLNEVRPKTVQISLYAILRIFQYSRESPNASGQLMGMEQDDALDITDFCPFATNIQDEIEQEEYQLSTIKCLREVNADHGALGWFMATSFDNLFNGFFLDTQLNYQTSIPNAILLIVDITRSAHGPPFMKAIRLTQDFMYAIRERKQKELGTILDSSIFEELPIKLSLSPIDILFLSQLSNDKTLPAVGSFRLPLTENLLKSMFTESILNTLDEVISETGRFQHYLRSTAKIQMQRSVRSKIRSFVTNFF